MQFNQSNNNAGSVNNMLGATFSGAHPTKIAFTELVTIQTELEIHSEVGDLVVLQPARFTDNTCSDAEVLRAFDTMVADMRNQLTLYLDRRAERRKNWKG